MVFVPGGEDPFKTTEKLVSKQDWYKADIELILWRMP